MISNNRTNLAALSLERAKAARLEIYLNMYKIREDPPSLDLLIPHFPNTKTLRVNQLSANEELIPFIQYPMINLRSLTLTDGGVGDWDRSVDPFKSSCSLRYLKLGGIPLYPSFLNLRTLTVLDLFDYECGLHLDTFLDFLEENCSLVEVTIRIRFVEPPLRSLQRRAPFRNQLRCLRITCYDAIDGQALVSGIALSKGAKLVINCRANSRLAVGVNDVLSNIPTTHLSNLLSPTIMVYRVHLREVRLLGPNGTSTFTSNSNSDTPFAEFPHLPLADIRRFHLDVRGWKFIQPSPGPAVFHHLSSFPALEMLTIECNTDLAHLLFPLLSNPSISPSLRTLAFSNCFLTEEFMEELARFASDRKNTTSAWLHRVVVAHGGGTLPSIASIRRLEEHVPVVDVRIDAGLPARSWVRVP